MNSEQYLANASPSEREVHDLDNEKTGSWECNLDEIIRAGHERPFTMLLIAELEGYDNCAYRLGGSPRYEDCTMPELSHGLYLLRQYSSTKGVHHFGILDVGNLLGYPMAGDHVVVHLTHPMVRTDRLSATGYWEVLAQINDVEGALARLRQALKYPRYDLVFNNCEHFARYVATGVRESRQVRDILSLAGIVGVVLLANTRRAA